MESIYFLVSDNIFEIISLYRFNWIVKLISFTCKLFSHHGYNITKMCLHPFCDTNSHRFKKLKYLTVLARDLDRNPNQNEKYNKQFTELSNINDLMICHNLENSQNINLTHFTNLTNLTFNGSSSEQIIFDYTRLKKIHGITYGKNSMLNLCYNLEYLNLSILSFKLQCDLLQKNTYTRLTYLSINFHFEHMLYFHQNYFCNIVELCFNQGHIDYSRHEFPMLTSLSLYNLSCSQNLVNMSRLKSLTLTRQRKSDINIHVFYANSLINLRVKNFERLVFSCWKMHRKSVFIHDNATHLKIIEIKHHEDIIFNYNMNDIQKLKSLKYVQILTQQNKQGDIFLTRLLFKQELIDRYTSDIDGCKFKGVSSIETK